MLGVSYEGSGFLVVWRRFPKRARWHFRSYRDFPKAEKNI